MELLQWLAVAATLYLVAVAPGAVMRFKDKIRRETEGLWDERVKRESRNLLHRTQVSVRADVPRWEDSGGGPAKQLLFRSVGIKTSEENHHA